MGPTAMLERLVPIHNVTNLTCRAVERELVMIKVAGKRTDRGETLRLAGVFRADDRRFDREFCV